MTRLIFWDVDTQSDFLHADGLLAVPRGEEIVPVLQALTDFAHEQRIPIVASADDHRLTDAEISDAPDWRGTFPPHCIHGSAGQRKIAETALREPLVIEPELQDPGALAHRLLGHRGDVLLHKATVDVFGNENVPALLRTLEPEAVVLYGVATDLSVRRTVAGLLPRLPRAELYVVTDAVRAMDETEALRVQDEWEREGVRMVDSAQILHGGLLDPWVTTAIV